MLDEEEEEVKINVKALLTQSDNIKIYEVLWKIIGDFGSTWKLCQK